MADFILHRKISVDTYPFPEGAFKIYGDGKFYNGFSIGATTNLTVVNEDGILKFSRGAAAAQEETTVILGTIPPNTKQSIYIDVAVPTPQNIGSPWLKINNNSIYIKKWSQVGIYNTKAGGSGTSTLQAGGVLGISFQEGSDLPAIPNLCSVRALWAL